MNPVEETTVSRLVQLLDRAQTREDELGHALDVACAQREEAQKALDAEREHSARLTAQVTDLISKDAGYAEIRRVNDELEGQNAGLKSENRIYKQDLAVARRENRALRGQPTVHNLEEAWDLYHGPQGVREDWTKKLGENFHQNFLDMIDHINKGAKIYAIKEFFVITGEGLKVAKDWVEAHTQKTF